ncbi:MAG: hypothetical protein LQ342_002331 [Letrouitia transgressa]|nr:MAG: hypothetical protein LQ342_002331 [Letrouitia transgressa]
MADDLFALYTNIDEIYAGPAPSEAQLADVSTAIVSTPQDNSAAIGSNLIQPSRSSSQDTLQPSPWSPSQWITDQTPPTPLFPDSQTLLESSQQDPYLEDVSLEDIITAVAASTPTMQQPTGVVLDTAPFYPIPPTADGAGFAPYFTSAPLPLPLPLPAANFAPQWQQPGQHQQHQQQHQQPPPPPPPQPTPAAPKPKRQRQRRENRHATIDTQQGAGGAISFAVQTTDSMHKTLAEDGNQTSRYNGFQPVPRFGKDGRCTRGIKRRRGVVGAIGADDDDKDDA